MVNLGFELFVAAFIAGTALSAAAGTCAETLFGSLARLDRPFVDSNRIASSLARMLLAGPYLLVGEAVSSREEGHCGAGIVMAAILVASAWCLCLGIVVLECANQISAWSNLAVAARGMVYEPL